MLGSTLLDVAIGISLLYLVFSLACSAATEWLAGIGRWRATTFKAAVCNLLAGAVEADSLKLQDRFKNHSVIASLASQDIRYFSKRSHGWPSYLAANTFTTVVFDLLGSTSKGPSTFWKLRHALSSASATAGIESTLTTFIGEVEQQVADLLPNADAKRLALLRARVNDWYDQGMDRASGWYKRKTQVSVFWIAVVLTAALNVDTIAIVDRLYIDPVARSVLVSTAMNRGQPTAIADPKQPADLKQSLGELSQAFSDAKLPVGWHAVRSPGSADGWALFLIEKFFGLAITVFALSLGAPFWFDTLSRLVNVRSSGNRPAATALPASVSTDEDSADGSTPAASGVVVKSLDRAPVALATAPLSVLPALPADDWSQPVRQADLKRVVLAADGFQAGNAVALARAALLAYQQPAQLRAIATTAWKIPTDDVQVFNALGQQAFAVATDRCLIVSFRGTVPAVLETILADAEICLVSDPQAATNGRVHCGFLAAVDAVATPIDAFVTARPTLPLFLSGHSLGAAMATLYAARRLKVDPNGLQGLYTFGSPRVGDATFVSDVQRQLRNRSFRVVDDQDLVTRVAPRRFGYDHLQQVMYLNTNGTLDSDGTGWTRFLNTVVDALNSFRGFAQQTLADHHMELYVRKLENLL